MHLISTIVNAFLKNRKAILLCGFIFLFMGAGYLLQGGVSMAENADSSAANSAAQVDNVQKQELINQKLEEIKKIQADINRYQSDISAKQKEGRTLKNEISIYENNISKNQLEIRETKINIEKAELEIEQSQERIEAGRESIEKNKEVLKGYLQALYRYQHDSFLEILISRDSLSDFLNEVGAVESVQNKIWKTVVALKREREDFIQRSRQLEEDQVAYVSLIEMRYEQNAELENIKARKNELLEATDGEEDKFQALLAQNKSLLPSLRAELRDLQSLGQDIKFDDAISASRYIGEITGVRPALLLGVLRVESGLGTNVGGGTYKIDMNPSQRPVFESIVSELGYDPNAMPVSKKPTSYQGWGGAMGPAQMMPATWQSYRGRITQITGHNPPDPWDLTDAVTAIAVKLSDVEGVTAGDRNAEYKAAGIYLAGSNWQKFPFYPNKVLYYADLYEKELNG